MGDETYPYQSELLAEREAHGAEEMLLMIIEERDLLMTEHQRRRIESCQDLQQLKLWAKRAVTVPTVADILD